MRRTITLTVASEENIYGKPQETEMDFRICLEQLGILLTPKQYEQVFKKLKEIKDILSKPQ